MIVGRGSENQNLEVVGFQSIDLELIAAGTHSNHSNKPLNRFIGKRPCDDKVLRTVIAQKDGIVALPVMPDTIDEETADYVEDNKPFEVRVDLVPDNELADNEKEIANPTNAIDKYGLRSLMDKYSTEQHEYFIDQAIGSMRALGSPLEKLQAINDSLYSRIRHVHNTVTDPEICFETCRQAIDPTNFVKGPYDIEFIPLKDR